MTLEDPTAPCGILRIRHPAVSARISLQGAQVLEWTPRNHQDSVLYLSPDATFAAGRAIRGGIPLCWPWFGAAASHPELPSHGFARTLPWQLIQAGTSTSGVELEFELVDSASTRQLWPHDFACRLTVRLGDTLGLALVTENTGHTAFVLTEALHTYIRVGDITRVSVSGLDGSTYLDTVGAPCWRKQTGDIHIAQEVDRQYKNAGLVTLTDPALRRKVLLTRSNSQTLVLWNPWIDKSARLADLPDDAWKYFVCVEAANAGEGASLVLEPGATHRIETALSVATTG